VDLAEEHLLGRPVQGTPLLDVPLQGAHVITDPKVQRRADPEVQRSGLG
jgi:hypothetical protein